MTPDGVDCVLCGDDASVDPITGRCECSSAGATFVARDEAGKTLPSGRCVTCDESRDGSQCTACPSNLPLADGDGTVGTCACAFTPPQGGDGECFTSLQNAQNAAASAYVNRQKSDVTSPLIQSDLFATFRRCLELSDSVACNRLANYCALQLMRSTSACSMLEYIESKRLQIDGHQKWVQRTPWIKVDQGDVDTITKVTIQTCYKEESDNCRCTRTHN